MKQIDLLFTIQLLKKKESHKQKKSRKSLILRDLTFF